MTILTLVPSSTRLGHPDGVAQAYGPTPGSMAEAPTAVGGGSVVDGSDASYLTMSEWQDDLGTFHIDVVDGLFSVPTGFVPTAMAALVRVRTPPAVLGEPEVGTVPNLNLAFADTAGTPLGSINMNNEGFVPLRTRAQADIADIAGFYEGPALDLDNPTEAGNWGELAYWPGLADALTGAGLWVSFMLFATSEADAEYVDLFEFRLLVAGEGGAVPNAPWLRQHPRSPLRIWPPERSHQRSIRRAGGYL